MGDAPQLRGLLRRMILQNWLLLYPERPLARVLLQNPALMSSRATASRRPHRLTARRSKRQARS
jgi:hypothetical protein